MCIIIYRPAENSLSMEMLELCAQRNKDGWGIMMPTETGIVRYRGMHFSEFKEVYESIPKDVEMAIHFRIKTDGLINVQNCHPFAPLTKEEDGEDMFLMHNGMIRTVKMHDKNMSDTWHWVEILLRPIVKLNPKIIHIPAFQWFMESSIGWSRILILDAGGNFVFLKEDDWKVNKEVKDGCRYSIEPPSLKKPEPAVTKYNGSYVYGGTKNNGASSYTDYTQPGYGQYRRGAGYGVKGNQAADAFEYDDDGLLVKQGGGTNGSSRFPAANVVELKNTTEPNVAAPKSPAGIVLGVREGEAGNQADGTVQKTAPADGRTDDALAGLSADVVELPKEGGETADAGLRRFPEGSVGKANLSEKEWLDILTASGLVESEEEETESPSDIELEQAHDEERYNFGIIPNSDRWLGLEFDNTRTHMLLTEKGSEDELPCVDAEDFEGFRFVDIFGFVKENPEEAALFLYRNYG